MDGNGRGTKEISVECHLMSYVAMFALMDKGNRFELIVPCL